MKSTFTRFAIAGCCVLAGLLASCIPNPDGGNVPLIPIGGGTSSGGSGRPLFPPRAPAEPMVPVIINESKFSPVTEQHGVVSADNCYQMEARFKREGRKVKLKSITVNPYNQGGGTLEFLCTFEGEDADPESTVFEDHRYNSSDEYVYP